MVWIRDPLHRFRSAFDYQRAVIRSNVSGLSTGAKGNCKDRSTWCELGPTCLAPFRLCNKARTGFAYSKQFDQLMLQFESATELAEALTSPNASRAAEAKALMNSETEHLHKGIGWYLDGGRFVEEHHGNMFVGTTDNQTADFQRLAARLGIESPIDVASVRRNPSKTIALSQLAVNNLKRIYQTDYSALHAMVRHGLVADLYGSENGYS